MKGWRFWAIWTPLALLALIGLFNHELWLDEMHHWLLAERFRQFDRPGSQCPVRSTSVAVECIALGNHPLHQRPVVHASIAWVTGNRCAGNLGSECPIPVVHHNPWRFGILPLV